MSTAILYTQGLTIGYLQAKADDFKVLEGLDLAINAGEVVGVLGPNGCGKSTLIRTLAGIQKPLSGSVFIGQEKVEVNKHLQLAQLISVVLTDRVEVKNLTVSDLVSMGRYPHTGWLGKLQESDHAAIQLALDQVHLLDYAKRDILTLSDGELQRAMIAKALVQDTPVILLDEPTAHLDLMNRIETMRLLRKLAKQTNKAILLSIHDLELALQTADKLWLINQSGQVDVGLPEDLVLNGSFEATFQADGIRFDTESGTYRINHPTALTLSAEGNSVTGFWTKRALERNGIMMDYDQRHPYHLKLQETAPRWTLESPTNVTSYSNIQDLLHDLEQIKLDQ